MILEKITGGSPLIFSFSSLYQANVLHFKKCGADELSHFSEPSSFHNSLQGYLNDTRSLLELHKASKVSIAEKEVILDNIGSWTGCLLKEQLLSSAMKRNPLSEEASCQV